MQQDISSKCFLHICIVSGLAELVLFFSNVFVFFFIKPTIAIARKRKQKRACYNLGTIIH